MRFSTKLRFGLANMLLKAANAQGITVFPGWQRASSLLLSGYDSLTRDGYSRNAVVYACISALAFDFPAPPTLVYNDDTDDAEAQPKHPLRKLLARPNAFMGERELWMYTMVYMAIGGNAYWHKIRNARGAVIELWPYSVANIEPYVDPNTGNWIDYYVYTAADGTQTQIPIDDIVHFKWPSVDPARPWLAQAPLLAVAREVGADNEMTAYLQSLLLNDAIPRTILTQNPQRFMTPEEIERAKAQFAANYGGNRRGGVMVLESGATISRLGLNLQELAFDSMHKLPEKRIAAAFRVPLSVAGIGDDPTYSNSEEAYERYVKSTLAPLWRLCDDEVQNALGDEFGAYVERDLSKVAALQEDQDQLWARVNSAFQAGRLTLNQANQLCGLPSVDGGDVFLWSASVFPVPAAQIATVAEAEIMAATTAPALPAQQNAQPLLLEAKANNSASARRTAKALQRLRAKLERGFEKSLQSYFDTLATTIVERAESAAKADDLPNAEQLLLESDGVTLFQLLQRYYLAVIEASWETWNLSLGIETAFEQSDPAVVRTVASAGTQVKQISATTLQAIRDVLKTATEEGWSISQLVSGVGDAPGLRDVVQQSYKGRAKTIARTELGNAQQLCAVERYKAAGVEKVLVLDGGSEDSDPDCDALNNSTQTLSWAKDNPLGHPNCVRCFAPYVED